MKWIRRRPARRARWLEQQQLRSAREIALRVRQTERENRRHG